MLRAPTLADSSVTVAPGPAVYATGAPTADSLGAGVGQGLGNLGASVSRIWEDQQRRVNASAVNQAAAKTDELANQLQIDHRTTKSGQDAVSSISDYQERLSNGISDAESGLSNDAQKQAFREWSSARAGQFDTALFGHAVSEGEKQYDSDTQAFKSSAINRAAINSTDPEAVRGAYDDMRKSSDAWADLRGLSPIEKQALKTKDDSSFWAAVIDQHLTDQRDITAKQVYDAHKDEMDPQTRDSLGKIIQSSNSAAEAQRQSAAIYAPGKTLEQMFGEADKITDQKVQAETKQRLENQHTLHLQAIAETSTNLLKDGLRVLNTDPRGLDAIPRPTLDALNQADPEKYQALVATAQRMIHREDVTTDQGNAKFIQLRADLSGVNGEEARNNALKPGVVELLSPVLSKADLRDIAKIRDDAASGKDTSGVKNQAEIAEQTLSINGYQPKPMDSKGVANPQAILFNRKLGDLVDSHRATTGKDPTRNEVQAYANGLMMQVPDGNGTPTPRFLIGYDKHSPQSALGMASTGAPVAAIRLDQFLPADVSAARAALQKAGAPADDASTLDYLNAKKNTAPPPSTKAPTWKANYFSLGGM